MKKIMTALVLAVLAWGGPALAEPWSAGYLKLDKPEAWKADGRTGPGYAIITLTAPETGPAVEAVIGHFNIHGLPLGDNPPVEDLITLSTKGLGWPGAAVTDLADGRGFFYQARENGDPAGLLIRSAIYSDNANLVYLVVTVPAAPAPQDWSEERRHEIKAMWTGLTADDPQAEAAVTAAQKYLPPEFFQ